MIVRMVSRTLKEKYLEHEANRLGIDNVEALKTGRAVLINLKRDEEEIEKIKNFIKKSRLVGVVKK